MKSHVCFLHHISDSGASHLAWAGLTPDLLEKSRSRVKNLAAVMVGLGAHPPPEL